MTKCQRRVSQSALFMAMLLSFLGASGTLSPAASEVRIGFCNGPPVSKKFTINLIICCPPLGAITVIPVTTVPVDCSDAAAVMAAISTAMASATIGGTPIFGGGATVVSSPVAGQIRFAFTPSAAFLATGCCIVGGGPKFTCGTVSMVFDCPCPKSGDPGGGGSKIKLCFNGPPPFAIPSTFAVKFEGCPIILIPLDGSESALGVRDKVLGSLLAAGYTALPLGLDKIEVCTDCSGALPTGIDEYGLVGGVPMDLALLSCPPTVIVGVEDESWTGVKEVYRPTTDK